MSYAVPLDAFGGTAVVVSGADGRVGLCNAPALKLLGYRTCPIGMRCWEMVGLRDEHGEPFCSPRCPVQQNVGRGIGEPRHKVMLQRPGRSPLPMELLSFPLPPRRNSRQAVLHLMLPRRPATVRTPIARSPLRLQRLTERELQVLGLLARGENTAGVAHRLCISSTTVRNHVQHILTKLEVHGRLQAILALREQGGLPPI